MARYIENLNECTDPTSGDYLWIVDASASASDKDRKVNVGKFPRLAVANTFTAAQTVSAGGAATALTANMAASNTGIALALGYDGATTGAAYARATLSGWDLLTRDLGAGQYGSYYQAGRNSYASGPAAGFVRLENKDGTYYSLWPDASGNLRILATSRPTNANDTAGTVVGAQTSSKDAKRLQAKSKRLPIDDVLAAVREGAEAVRRFTYKSGAFNNEEFEGVVVDYAPRYGLDRDDTHPAGKSLNVVVAIGDLLRAVAWLVEREEARLVPPPAPGEQE